MRLLAADLVSSLECWLARDLRRLALFGPDGAGARLTPSAATGYSRWLLTMLAAALLPVPITIALVLIFWRALGRWTH